MTEWTPERLDALPVNTIIEWTEGEPEEYPPMGWRTKKGWEVRYYGGTDVLSEGVIAEADPGSIRLVSVPVDALLSHAALSAMLTAWTNARELRERSLPSRGGLSPVQEAMRAAIAHVTGGVA